MLVREVTCKSALSPSGLPEFEYSLNPYKNCAHGCVYCYAPDIVRVPRGEWGAWVEVKRNIPLVLAMELKRKPRGRVAISLVTDPYQPAEAEHRLTRYCLEQLARRDWPVTILTKSSLARRDLGLLSGFSDAEVGVTLTTVDEALRELLEPGASPVEARLSLMGEAVDAGVGVYAFLGPLVPDQIDPLLEAIAGTGVKRVMFDPLRLRPGVMSAIEGALEGCPEVMDRLKGVLHFGYAPIIKEATNHARALGLVVE